MLEGDFELVLTNAQHWPVAYSMGRRQQAPVCASATKWSASMAFAARELTYARYDQLLAERDVLRLCVRLGDSLRAVDIPVAVLVR